MTKVFLWLSTGSPQGCYPPQDALRTHDCTSIRPTSTVIKFTDDTTVVGLVKQTRRHAGRRSRGWQRVLPAQLTAQHQQNQVNGHKDDVDVNMNIATQQRWFNRPSRNCPSWSRYGRGYTGGLLLLRHRECSAMLHRSTVCQLLSGRQKSSAEGRGTAQEIISCPRSSLENIVRARKITAEPSHLVNCLIPGLSELFTPKICCNTAHAISEDIFCVRYSVFIDFICLFPFFLCADQEQHS